MDILKVKDATTGQWNSIPAIIGPPGSDGPAGPSGVYVGDTEPSDADIRVWIDTDDDASRIVDLVYPIGSIYMSVNSASPAVLFGGTWERIQDTFLLAAGTNHQAGSTGGEETHTLTKDEMPSHTHRSWYYNANGTTSFGFNYSSKGLVSAEVTNQSGIENTGGGQAHNNMPPYLTVYMWKRTA